MKIRIQQGKLEKFACDLLVVKWVQGQTRPNFRSAKTSVGQDEIWAVDQALGGLISQAMKDDARFKGKEGEAMVFPLHDKRIAARKVMVLGLGEQKNVTVDCVRRSAARIVKEARRQHAKRVATILIGTGTAGIDPFTAAKAMTEGALLAGYAYNKYKAEEAQKDVAFPGEFVIVTAGVHENATLHNAPQPPLNLRGGELLKVREAERGIKEGELYSQATIFARELVNEPSSNMVPKHLADVAVKIVKEAGGIVHNSPQPSLNLREGDDRKPPLKLRGGAGGVMSVQILNRAQCEKVGMGAYLGVAKGSEHEPFFIHLVYKPPHPASGHPLPRGEGKLKKIAIVGKGITFDSGGMSLKPAQYMETMKCDMAGCAAMLGVFSVISKLKPNVEVHGISAVCENMPSGRAMKPGDIVRTVSGKTIEVLNTDAEGRLTLADAFGYVNKFIKPDAMVDMATLTGACVVALGEEVTGYMGNNRALLDQVKKAAEAGGERVWELPLVEEYREQIKSHVADYSNITPGRYAGAITAGLFLEAFVDKTPWVHMDIAGPAFAEKEVIPYMPKGATGFGVRTILELLKSM